MRKYIFLMCLLIPAVAYAKFNLPIEVICNGKPLQGWGAVICAQKDPPTHLKVKIPPTKGQLRVTDCNSDLTSDGNPDDFNTQIERQGWWIFSRTVRVLSTTPLFSLPLRSYDDCGITASVAGEKTGVQTADVVFDSKMDGDFVEMTCANKKTSVDRVALCQALEGAELTFTPKNLQGTIIVIGTGCGVSARSEGSSPIKLRVPSGRCVIDLSWVNLDSSKRSRVLVIGHPRSDQELDNPLMVREGSKRRIFKPIGAAIMSTEIYSGDTILWRSGEREQDSYHIDPKEDNASGLEEWPKGAIACHTAYSRTLQSISGSCYTLDSDREIPYLFK
jgi:hypothetical protein